MKNQIDTKIVIIITLDNIKHKLDWAIKFYSEESKKIDCCNLLYRVQEELELLRSIIVWGKEFEIAERLTAMCKKIAHTSGLDDVNQLVNECYEEVKQLESDARKELAK
jgi:hypothetical protein